MSDIEKQQNTSVPNMDDEEERRRVLNEALSFDEGETSPGAPTTSQTAATSPTPAAQKSKTAPKGMASKFSKNRNTSANTASSSKQGKNPMEATGANNATTSAPTKSGVSSTFQISGSNIGSRASEPEWTREELQQIADACGVRLTTVAMTETRRSIPDPNHHYLTTDDEGSIVTKKPAILPNPRWDEFKLGLGRVKADEKTGKSKLYSDVVMVGNNWLLSQWTSKNVIMEGVPEKILEKGARPSNGRPERRIGHDFARIGLPKTSFGPIFETLKTAMPSILEGVSVTRGYYWLNASWGVTNNPGNFVYSGANGVRGNTHKLYEAMKMIMGMSSYGAAAVAISIANESRMVNGKLTSEPNKYELSIKIHNMLHVKKVPYHSPPQSSATGFEVSEDMFSEAEILEPMSNMGMAFNDTASAFATPGPNPFLNVAASVTEGAIPGNNNNGLLM